MIKEIKTKIEKFDENLKSLFISMRSLIFQIEPQVEERIWASLPSYYKGTNFIRLIPFKNYINIEATAILSYLDKLNGYKITPKGMLRVDVDLMIPYEVLKEVFKETLK